MKGVYIVAVLCMAADGTAMLINTSVQYGDFPSKDQAAAECGAHALANAQAGGPPDVTWMVKDCVALHTPRLVLLPEDS